MISAFYLLCCLEVIRERGMRPGRQSHSVRGLGWQPWGWGMGLAHMLAALNRACLVQHKL